MIEKLKHIEKLSKQLRSQSANKRPQPPIRPQRSQKRATSRNWCSKCSLQQVSKRLNADQTHYSRRAKPNHPVPAPPKMLASGAVSPGWVRVWTLLIEPAPSSSQPVIAPGGRLKLLKLICCRYPRSLDSEPLADMVDPARLEIEGSHHGTLNWSIGAEDRVGETDQSPATAHGKQPLFTNLSSGVG